jgi:hypothetical protein
LAGVGQLGKLAFHRSDYCLEHSLPPITFFFECSTACLYSFFLSRIYNCCARPVAVDIPAELRNLLDQVTQAGQQGRLDEITTIDAESAIKKAIALAGKPASDRQAILTHLTTALITITATPQNAVGLDPLTTAINNCIVLVRQSIT